MVIDGSSSRTAVPVSTAVYTCKSLPFK